MMLQILDMIRGTDTLSTFCKLLTAVICGGLIGIEREYKRRPAGFRTHILISLGAAMTTLTSQFIVSDLSMPSDPGRLGAQVIAGIGFIGAGTIIVSKRNRVKGLTTAAGLWTTAITGLASGMGFYECSIVATLLVLFAEIVLSQLENRLHSRHQEVHLYIEYTGSGYLNYVVEYFRKENIPMLDVEIIKKTKKDDKNNIAIITIQLHRHQDRTNIVKDITNFSQTIAVEIL
ncbi:MAG: MgtC/SapB family protein [Lachnospiraceae bacterium]|nr:MgtC/SapB family protein [Lachnospiraceae bacterium]